MVWFLDLYTQFSTARGDQCQQRKNLAPNRKSSRRVIWTGDPCETDTILTSMVEANAFTLQGWGHPSPTFDNSSTARLQPLAVRVAPAPNNLMASSLVQCLDRTAKYCLYNLLYMLKFKLLAIEI